MVLVVTVNAIRVTQGGPRGQSSGKTLAPLDPGCIEDTMYFLELRIENM